MALLTPQEAEAIAERWYAAQDGEVVNLYAEVRAAADEAEAETKKYKHLYDAWNEAKAPASAAKKLAEGLKKDLEPSAKAWLSDHPDPRFHLKQAQKAHPYSLEDLVRAAAKDEQFMKYLDFSPAVSDLEDGTIAHIPGVTLVTTHTIVKTAAPR